MASRRRRGGNAIEFALILPPLLALLTGIMDYGWYQALRIAADSSARQGARVGALTPQDDAPSAAAGAAAADRWNDLGLPGTPTIVAFRAGTPQAMVVRVQVDVASLIGLVAGPSTLESTAVQRMEEQP